MTVLRPAPEPTASPAARPETRLRITRALLVLAALSALVATISDIPAVVSASASVTVVQTWRLYGFALFTGLFIVLAVTPKGHRGIWELVIANKLLLTCTAIAYAIRGGIAETTDVLVWDGSLTVLLIAAYITGRAWPRRPG